MRLAGLMFPDSKLFLKSAFGRGGKHWPAISFSKKSVGRRMRGVYDPARDFVIFVGTTNPENTLDPAHRGRLLSLVRMDIRREVPTRDLVPDDAPDRDRWPYSFAMLAAWAFDALPSARDTVPRAFSELGNPANFGGFVQLGPDERAALAEIQVSEVELALRPAGLHARARTELLSVAKELGQELYRMALLIDQRRAASGTTSMRLAPHRDANPKQETLEMLHKKWEAQKGYCGLCNQPIAMPAAPGLLQPSPDRIDSGRPDYGDTNVHITHLGCNLAKNKFDVDDFEDWLEVVRDSRKE